ncbi:MAG TPA: hypothetical protein VM324_11140 [Egibacteraceae bacterium]|nr:hypothetical protein [Egibacteraceae bacterium]
MSFRDRFLTRRTAEAITAPSSIMLGGAGAAAAILAGAPAAVAAGAGAAVYAGWVALRMPRAKRRTATDIDPRRLGEPWRWYVKEALDARARYERSLAGADAGPLRERLREIGARVDDAVEECWRIANRGQQLERALRQLVPEAEVARRLRGLADAPPSETNERLAAALHGQIATYRRISGAVGEARDRLQVLEARLDETVARAVELGLRVDDPVELGGLGADVDALVVELEALRRGLDETAGQTAGG